MGRRRKRAGDRVLSGLLLIDKPSGITSFGVVNQVRRALGVRRVGHTGTLDPMATGLLPVCVGQATKLARFVTDADKAYRAHALLGVATDTLDADGEVTQVDDPDALAAVDGSALEGALEAFRGAITQRPPAYSAIKVDGERLYAKARRGEEVEVPLREVTIHALEMMDMQLPTFAFDVRCSKGTYVRTLAADIAAHLGLSAHLLALRRTAVGAHQVDDAISLEAFLDDPEAAVARRLIPLTEVASHLPSVIADAQLAEHFRHGRRRPVAGQTSGLARLLDEAGGLIAIIEPCGEAPAEIIRGFPPE